MVIDHRDSGLRLNRFVRTVQSSRGFTLLELVIVVAIMAVLAAMAITGFSTFKEKAKVARCTEEIRSLEKEIVAYATDKGSFPANLTEIGRQDLLDPWGGNYVYRLTILRHYGVSMNTDFDLYSKGSDGNSADSMADLLSLDDIIRFSDGSFCGVAGMFTL